MSEQRGLLLVVLLNAFLPFIPWTSASFQCCSEDNCDQTCETTQGQWCFRYSGREYTDRFCVLQAPPCQYSRNQRGYFHRTPEQPSISPLKFEVERTGKIRKGISGCGSERCNKCAFPVELCDYPGRRPVDELKCSCTPEGMNSTWLARGNKHIDFSQYCRNNECSFKEIDKRFDKIKKENPSLLKTLGGFKIYGYTCALTHGHENMMDPATGFGISGTRYGCDIEISSTSTSATGRRLVEYVGPTKYTVECNDKNNCNDVRYFSDSTNFPPVGDLSKFRLCHFNTRPSDGPNDRPCDGTNPEPPIRVQETVPDKATVSDGQISSAPPQFQLFICSLHFATLHLLLLLLLH